MKKIDKSNFCNAPFSALEITPEGNFRICCKMPHKSILKEDLKPYKVNIDGISQTWNSLWLQNFRQRFINNERPVECKMCWDDEAAGIVSYRKQLENVDVDVENPKIKLLVLKLSNKCNCACRICSFWLSSLWQKELEKTGRFNKDYIWFIEENDKNKITEGLWKDWESHLSTIETLLIYGGEPLINAEVLNVLNFLVKNNHSQNIQLILNTNATVLDEDIIRLFYKFKGVNLYFSIDDVNERYDYERWPAKYRNIKSDLLNFHATYERKPIDVSLYTSISIFNIFNLHEIFDEFKNFPKFTINFDNLIHEPYILSIYGLPEEIKPKVEHYLDTLDFNQRWENSSDVKSIIKNFLYLYKNNYSTAEYIEKLDSLLGTDDERRKQYWRETFPSLNKILNSRPK